MDHWHIYLGRDHFRSYAHVTLNGATVATYRGFLTSRVLAAARADAALRAGHEVAESDDVGD